MAAKIVPHPVLDRIRALYHYPSDAAMARALKIAPQDIPRFRRSGNTPYKQILNECPPKDWEFLFRGEAPAEGGTILSDCIKKAIDAGYDVTPRKRE